MLASYVLSFAGQTALALIPLDSPIRIRGSLFWLYYSVEIVSVLIGAAYGLYAVFRATYRSFEVDVRTDRIADEF